MSLTKKATKYIYRITRGSFISIMGNHVIYFEILIMPGVFKGLWMFQDFDLYFLVLKLAYVDTVNKVSSTSNEALASMGIWYITLYFTYLVLF